MVVGERLAAGRLGVGDRERDVGDLQPVPGGEELHEGGIPLDGGGQRAAVDQQHAQPLAARLGADGEAGGAGPHHDQIENFVRIGETEDATWRQFFAEHRIQPLQLVYEEMVADLDGTVGRLLAFLGIPAEGIKIKPPRLRRQADHRSREWEERYRRIADVPSPSAAEG